MSPQFNELLTRQVGNEFAASQQYIAIAAWFDGQDLPQLAKHFYRQSLEERNDAMMMVRYILDRGIKISIPGIEPVRNDFTSAEEPLVLGACPGGCGHGPHQGTVCRGPGGKRSPG